MYRKEIIGNLKEYVKLLRELGYIAIPYPSTISQQNSKKTLEQEDSREALRIIAEEVAICKKCRLWEKRTNTVPGDGATNAKLVFVGEAPGQQEDLQGIPFVGRAGKLLEKLLSDIGLKREDVFICNVVKCRPPNNRDPQPDKISACEPILIKQLEIIKPLVICALGRHAAQTLLRDSTGINRLRGHFYNYHGIPLLPTLHPAAILRAANLLPDIESDFQLLKQKLMETQDG
ncbi:MAG TPA: uracil-DNA glycosylase [Candidatus Sumerlaeota bacterium]|nr:uracil-DNA glycosylase [Candidatus Sumerlaeota bacterium]HRR30579.1 uracil-DNA glycosylase [Candidatus Sumerlaeia bacterium]